MSDTPAPLQQLKRGFPWLPALEVGPGWSWILGDLCQDPEKILGRDALMRGRERDTYDDEPCVRVVQVKEKWASLRVYLSPHPDAARAAIDKAERISTTICEGCGRLGELRSGGWWSTLCTEHHIESLEKKRLSDADWECTPRERRRT